MQILAWMWCVAFSMYFGSMWVFGFTVVAHLIIISAIVVTVATFKVTRDMDWGYRTPSRARSIYINGKRVPLRSKRCWWRTRMKFKQNLNHSL